MADVDLAVIGGGPAGLATAIHAARGGARVVLFERRRPPIDKACGEGLMPDGVAALAGLGIAPGSLGGRPFVGIAFGDGRHRIEGRFPAGPGLGVRRTRLHEALWSAAERAGVALEPETAATASADGTVESARGTLRARLVAAADGLHSPTRRRLELGRPGAPRRRRYGLRRHFRIAPWSERVEVTFGDGAEAYVTPVADELVGVALLVGSTEPRPGLDRFDVLLARFPELAARLADAAPADAVRGAGPLHQRCSAVVRGRVALVGDAAGYLDAITGEGISVALHQARALAGCLTDGNLAAYARAHRRIVRTPNLLCRLVLLLSARPRTRARALAGLARDPKLFDRLLAVHTRELAVHRLGFGGLVRLAFGLARPVW
ncbi:MAG: NAD(P)/FAD-dependent oxidoreductase [Acidobacteriota bacterium]